MVSPLPPQSDPFDNPNSAIRAFNDYFRSLRNEYGEDAIRALGFGKADLAKLQGPLTKMLSDPSVTTEQRRQAYQQARDALAQRITTPLAAARSTPSAPPVGTPVEAPKPEVEVRRVMPTPSASMPYSILKKPGAEGTLTPSQSQLDAFYAAGGAGARGSETFWNPYTGAFEKEQYSQPTSAGVTGVGAPPPMPETVRPVMPEMAVRSPPPMPVAMVGNGALRPTEAQLAAYQASGSKGHWNSDTGAFEEAAASPFAVTPEVEVRRVTPPMPEVEVPDTRALEAEKAAAERAAEAARDPIRKYVDPGPPTTVPSATDYIASMVTPPKPAELPMPPVGSPALLGNAPRPVDPSMVQPTPPVGLSQKMIDLYTPPQPRGDTGRAPDGSSLLGPNFRASMSALMGGSNAPQATPPMQPMQPSMNTQPGADFDRNVARQIFDAEFRTLREKYGDDGLRAAGFTPRTLSSLQAPLTNVQKDNTISYDQSSAALEDALQKLRGYNFGGAQPAAPAPIMGGTLGGTLGGMMADVPPPMSSTPQAPNPITQGMAMGGLINKYYR